MTAWRVSRGFSMIEILVTIVIIMVGLLGLAGLIARSQQAEMESYQRVQALVLLQDMVDRMNANRANAASYKGTGVKAGTGKSPTCPGTSLVEQDICQWHTTLLGASKQVGGNSIGAILGARGCIFELDAANRIYLVSIAWQGMGDTFAPTDNPACGTADDYGGATRRRVVSATVRMANLSGT